MNRQEVNSAINDFRKAFRDDLGCPMMYGERLPSTSGGFSIDEDIASDDNFKWMDITSTNNPLYATVQVASIEELQAAGLSTTSKGIITCIYEDILDLQPTDSGGTKKLVKEKVVQDRLHVKLNGVDTTYRIVDFAFAFQLKDTYIFIKFGVSQE